MPPRDPKERRNPAKVSQDFGSRLRTLRERKSWSQEDLAHKTGIHVTYLSGLERGRRNPTLNIIACLASSLGVSLSELLKDITVSKK